MKKHRKRCRANFSPHLPENLVVMRTKVRSTRLRKVGNLLCDKFIINQDKFNTLGLTYPLPSLFSGSTNAKSQ